MEERRKLIEELVNQALSLFNENGNIEGTNNIIKYKFLLYIIAYLLWEEKVIEGNTEEERDKIEDVLFSLRKESEISYEKFIEYYNKVSQRDFKPKNYYVLFSFNISEENMERLNGIKLNGNQLESINKYLFYEELREIEAILDNLGRYYSYYPWAKIEITAFSSQHALHLGWKFSEYIRALANFILTKNIFTIHQNPPQPKTVILPSKYYFVFDENGKYCNYSLTVENFEYKRKNLKEVEIQNIINFISEFDNIPESNIKKILLECFYLYNIAMDNIDYAYSYILLWSIIDKIAKRILASNREENNRPIQTLKKLYDSDKFGKSLIDALWKKRNLIVHEGSVLDAGLDDINWLKFIVCDLLSYSYEKCKSQ